MQRNAFVSYIDRLLRVREIKDYCPNGLQVAGAHDVRKIVCAVTASESAIDYAVLQEADVLLVHHGYFWKGEDPCVIGMKYQRIKKLLENHINLLAYHLPLDLHMTLGNNACLARRLGFAIDGYFDALGTKQLGFLSHLPEPIQADQLAEKISTALSRKPLVVGASSGKSIQRVAWVTGAAQDAIEDAKAQGCDAFISGEISERTFYQAKEMDIHYFAAGHHATERYGVQALAQYLCEEFSDLSYEFFDVDNPV